MSPVLLCELTIARRSIPLFNVYDYQHIRHGKILTIWSYLQLGKSVLKYLLPKTLLAWYVIIFVSNEWIFKNLYSYSTLLWSLLSVTEKRKLLYICSLNHTLTLSDLAWCIFLSSFYYCSLPILWILPSYPHTTHRYASYFLPLLKLTKYLLLHCIR